MTELHSMSDSADFRRLDRAAARKCAEAAQAAGIGHIIYYPGGPGHPEADLSELVRSR